MGEHTVGHINYIAEHAKQLPEEAEKLLRDYAALLDRQAQWPSDADVERLDEYMHTEHGVCLGKQAMRAALISSGIGGGVDGPTSNDFGSWCNILTHTWMYVQEGNKSAAWLGVEQIEKEMREWQRKLAASPKVPS